MAVEAHPLEALLRERIVVLDGAMGTMIQQRNLSADDFGGHLGAMTLDHQPRQSEVLRMLADGLSNKEVAWQLQISEHTVKYHLSSVFGKLGAGSRTEAVMLGIQHGIILI